MLDRVKIFLKLEQDEDGYPPVTVESVWACCISAGRYKIQNIPFYSKDVCLDDVVSAKLGGDNELLFCDILESSDNSTIRIIFFDKGREYIKDVLDYFESIMCTWEGCNKHFFAINIPNDVNLDKVIDYLDGLFSNGYIDYEYGLVRQ